MKKADWIMLCRSVEPPVQTSHSLNGCVSTYIHQKEIARKAAGEILRHVDQFIKAGEIDRAIREIIHAKEIDPTNGYVYAYEERLAFLKAEHEEHVEQERTRKQAEEAARARDVDVRRQTN